METAGQRFKKIRQQMNLSQEAFGSIIGLSKSAVSAVENDKVFVSAEILRTLFIDCNINLNWLICGAENMFNNSQTGSIKAEIFAEVERILAEKGIK